MPPLTAYSSPFKKTAMDCRRVKEWQIRDRDGGYAAYADGKSHLAVLSVKKYKISYRYPKMLYFHPKIHQYVLGSQPLP